MLQHCIVSAIHQSTNHGSDCWRMLSLLPWSNEEDCAQFAFDVSTSFSPAIMLFAALAVVFIIIDAEAHVGYLILISRVLQCDWFP